MSETTKTRAELRRAICTELQMPFHRRFTPGYLTMDSTSTVSKLIDTTLMQRDGFWNGGWIFVPDTGEVSIIRSFSSNERSAFLEMPLASASDTDGNPFEYEIHTLWNAVEIHAAINRAIEIGGRTFHETVVDETLIHQEDVLTYALTGLSKKVFQLNKVWIENPGNMVRGTATAGAASTITFDSPPPSDITTSWKISIYDGTGKGQIRNYASAVGNVVTVDTAWTTTPDTTSKYAVWDPTEEIYDWVPLHTIYTDAKEFPDYVRFRATYPVHYGCRIRLEYLAVPSTLTTDASTTIVPSEYVLPKACSILHGQKLNDTKADRDMHFAESQRYGQEAEMYLAKNAPHSPDTLIQAQSDFYSAGDLQDPLNWR